MLDAEIIAQIHELESPGEPSLLAELLEAFRVSAPRQIERLRSALMEENATAFADAAHALKGTAASIGALRLQTVAGTLERLGRERELVNVAPALSGLDQDFAEAFEALAREEIRYREELSARASST